MKHEIDERPNALSISLVDLRASFSVSKAVIVSLLLVIVGSVSPVHASAKDASPQSSNQTPLKSHEPSFPGFAQGSSTGTRGGGNTLAAEFSEMLRRALMAMGKTTVVEFGDAQVRVSELLDKLDSASIFVSGEPLFLDGAKVNAINDHVAQSITIDGSDWVNLSADEKLLLSLHELLGLTYRNISDSNYLYSTALFERAGLRSLKADAAVSFTCHSSTSSISGLINLKHAFFSLSEATAFSIDWAGVDYFGAEYSSLDMHGLAILGGKKRVAVVARLVLLDDWLSRAVMAYSLDLEVDGVNHKGECYRD